MPTDMSKYPENWSEIRNRILLRAGGSEDDPRVGARCENCGVRNYAVGWRDTEGHFHPAAGNAFYDQFEYTGSYAEAREVANFCNEWGEPGEKYIVIVLTVAHVHDPSPMNCEAENLAAWCQRCHNVHDMPGRVENRKRKAQGELVQLSFLMTEEVEQSEAFDYS